ncbi:uncharacterized protein YfbL-like [Ptychodera flava]|uniref:uncharacterized protein YfbL-like n=1 Tax=Ptychodera flava TaxID=63121 RepID=UPI00396A49D4
MIATSALAVLHIWAAVHLLDSFQLVGAENSNDTLAADLRTILEDHFSDCRNHEVVPKNKNNTIKYIAEAFTGYGLEVELHKFTVQGYAAEKYVGTNVIGILNGERRGTANDNVFVVGAHFDTVATSPGVDDNGSGMAALIEAVKLVTSEVCLFNNTVVFVAFDLSEDQVDGSDNRIGSAAFVSEWLVRFLDVKGANSTFGGAVILESLMNYDSEENSQTLPAGAFFLLRDFSRRLQARKKRGDFIAVVGRQADADLISGFSEQWDQLETNHFMYEQIILSSSALTGHSPLGAAFEGDHESFWQRNNLRAILLTDTGGLRNAKGCYHKQCDDVNSITEEKLSFLAKTTRSVANMVKEFGKVLELECSQAATGHLVSGASGPRLTLLTQASFGILSAILMTLYGR